MMKKAALILQFKLCLIILTMAQSPSFLRDQFYDEKIDGNWEQPVGIVFDEMGRGFVWQANGIVWRLDELDTQSASPLLDISEEVLNTGDHGMLGFVLHPNFQENGYFYLLYTVDRHYWTTFGTPDYDPKYTITKQATFGRITRYQADPSTDFTTIIPNSRKVILGKTPEEGIPILMESHGIGSLVFGTDGTLLVSTGDAGSYESMDEGSDEKTYYKQALEDGILDPNDNVGAFRSLSLSSLNGKILRIDPETGLGIPSNPYYDPDQPNEDQSKIWVTGFRNPFRFTIAPETGSHYPEEGVPGVLMIGDVGTATWEELNVAKEGGQCFGWPLYEGFEHHWGFVGLDTYHPDYINPVYPNRKCPYTHFRFKDLVTGPTPSQDFRSLKVNPCDWDLFIPEEIPMQKHTRPALSWSGLLWNPPPKAKVSYFDDSGNVKDPLLSDPESPVRTEDFPGFSTIPGFFYQGDQFPDSYRGKFFQADLSGWIRTIDFDENWNVTEVDTFALWEDKGIVHLTENPITGEVYWTHIYSNEVHKISFGGNPAPIAKIKVDQQFGASPLTVSFNGEDSYDPDGGSITYHWDFGDSHTSEDINPTHQFTTDNNTPKSFDVTLTVKDSAGLTGSRQLPISINNTPPSVDITSFEDGEFFPISGQTFTSLEADVSDDEHSRDELSYEWQLFLHHNTHYHPEPPVNEISPSVIIDPVGCVSEKYWYRIKLTVKDAVGLSASDEVELFPYCDGPITTYLNFYGIAEIHFNQLQWTSQQQNSVKTYEIQRSADYRFETIGSIPFVSSGQYTYKDLSPIRGLNYYRLKAIDESGAYDYSEVIAIKFPPKLTHRLYPNPARGEVTLWLEQPSSPQIRLEIFNLLGQEIADYQWQIDPNSSFEQKINTANWMNGTYHYRITDGDRQVVHSLVIGR